MSYAVDGSSPRVYTCRFQFPNLSGIESINNEALKELSLK